MAPIAFFSSVDVPNSDGSWANYTNNTNPFTGFKFRGFVVFHFTADLAPDLFDVALSHVKNVASLCHNVK